MIKGILIRRIRIRIKMHLRTMFLICSVMSSKLFHSKEAGKILLVSRSTATP